MPWIEIEISTTASHIEYLTNFVYEHEAQALTLQDAGNQPIYEPAPDYELNWDEIFLTALFDITQNMELLVAALNTEKKLGRLSNFKLKHIADENWERKCLIDFKPQSFGKKLWVCPSWLTPPDESGITIILDPGLAFGTGTHATTALCLEWLDAHIVGNETIIDYGCGSGILAIAALKLGAKTAYAVDHDVLALTNTQENAKRNNVTVKTFFPAEQPYDLAMDLCLANILAGPLISLAEKFSTMVKPAGQIVLSGILAEQYLAVATAYKPWFEMSAAVTKKEWVLLTGRRK